MNLNLRLNARLRSRIKLPQSHKTILLPANRFYATSTPISTEEMSGRKQDTKGNNNERGGSNSKSGSGPSAGDKAYASTLLLPKTEFPIWVEPSSTREQFQHRTTEGIYKWQQENLSNPAFILHDGPPYANGNLHTGHALNKILKDAILRYRILQGQKVNYVPGWDCHGLPVENKTLERLKAEPNTLPPSTVRSAAKETAEAAISIQREEMMQFGLVGDWSKEGTYRTMDNSFESRQLRIFQEMVKNGVIYRQFRPVHWSPSSKTALAEAELTYEMHTSTAAYVAFHADKESLSKEITSLLGERELKILIWTTTPWTLPTNMAISAHPEMDYRLIQREGRTDILLCAASRLSALEAILGQYDIVGSIRGAQLENARYKPLFGDASVPTVKRPVIMGNDVLEDAGTGLVHMAPAHGHEDYQALQSLGILRRNSLISIVDENGRYTSGVEEVWGSDAGARLVGKEVLFGGNKEVLSMLEENGSERLLKVERYRHRYPYDWRTGKPLIIRATAQWFANLDGVKERALDALENVAFYPPAGKRRFQSFINERSEWCISRQRTWGVPIPSLHVSDTGAALLDTESLDHILPILETKGTSYWWDGSVEEFMSPATRVQYSPDQLRKGTDTMDVWFDSGTSWALMRTEANQTPIADVYLEGSDQHRGWFQSSLLTAIASSDKEATPPAPFKRLVTHGFVLDEKGRKMSKSLGNVISPITVINGGQNNKQDPAYGADGLRLWALSTEYAGDVVMSKLVLKQSGELLRKLRVTMRFLLGSLQDKLVVSSPFPQECSILDRYVLNELWTLERDSKKAYEEFSFQQVVANLSHFVNTTLSSLYFDVSKDVLYADPEASRSRSNVLYVLSSVLETMTPIIAPLVPYLAEEVHDVLDRSKNTNNPTNSVFTRGWKTASDNWKNEQAKEDMSALLEIRHAVNNLLEKARMEKRIRSSLEAAVRLTLPSDAQVPLLHPYENFLRHLFIVSDVELQSGVSAVQPLEGDWLISEQLNWKGMDIKLSVLSSSKQKCPRCWSYTRETDKTLCGRCDDALATTTP